MSSDTFNRDFSKQLAEALLGNEDSGGQRTKEEQVEHAYNSLCYDDPRVESDEACRLLTKALKDKSGRYHLSERLVDGIRQATARTQVDIKPKAEPDEETATSPPSSELRAAGGATPLGYALLALAVFCEIPLQCCESTNLKDVQILLGSFRGPEERVEEPEKEEYDEDIDVEARIQAIQSSQQSQSEQQQGETQYEEVWADESDPSDFDFEPNAREVDWSAWEDVTIDPSKLSKPLSDGWHQVQHAVSNLLKELNLAKLQPINADGWRRHRVSDSLTQLTLTLAMESSNVMLKNLRRWSVQPLNLLRDRYLSKHDCATDYLILTQSLIAVNAGKNDNPDIFQESSLMGLASLSSACEQVKQYEQVVKVRTCALECCENLATLVSQFATAKEAEDESDEWVGLVNALLPLLEVISNVNMDGTKRVKLITLSAKEAQWFLNSDFLRELIVFSAKRYSPSLPAFCKLSHQGLVGSLLSLSLQNMQMLGKYVYRVPEMGKLFSGSEFVEENLVEHIVWSLMGSHFAGTSVLRRKDVTPVTVEWSREIAITQFDVLCKQVVDSLAELGRLRSMTKVEEFGWKESILELSRFANYLVCCVALSKLWKETMSKDVLDPKLALIKSALSSLPPADRTKADKVDGEDDDEELREKQAMKNQLIEEEALVRTTVKILSMSLDEKVQSVGYSSKTD